MFETAELGHKVAKEDYNKEVPTLRTELLEVQYRLRGAGVPVIVLFGGVDAAGKSETVNLLNEWMDPRWLVTFAYGSHSDEERERPEFWRYWRDLPSKGQIGLFMSAWYSEPILQRVRGKLDEERFDKKLERIATFEKELTDDGALILKFWMHLNRSAQKKRFEAFEKDPLTSWRVDKSDWENLDHYDEFVQAAERAITRTSTGHASWQIVEGHDLRYAGLSVGRAVRDALRKHLVEMELKRKLEAELRVAAAESEVAPEVGAVVEADGATGGNVVQGLTILSGLEMEQALTKKQYQGKLATYQAKLHRLQHQASEKGISSLVVFEGWDAGGKGGAIRRVTQSLEARDYRVIPIAAPTDEELAHHYLWRFWRHLSRAGRFTIFDRSWYGRILVERVEGFASEVEWRRSYAEINDFEDQLVEHGIVVSKFWLHITPEEQLRRFKEREVVAYKRWKLTDEDWRNREKWSLYEEAVNDMVERTSTLAAPWTLVEGNSKLFARVKVLRTLCERLEQVVK